MNRRHPGPVDRDVFFEGGKGMLTEQRYEIILDLLREKNSVTVTELKDILDASESTVRRDITALYKLNLRLSARRF